MLHSAGEVAGKGRGRGARAQANHHARAAAVLAQFGHSDLDGSPPPPRDDPPSLTGDAEELVTAQAPPSPVNDNGAAGDASDHAMDKTLADKEEVMKTITVAVLALRDFVQDDSVQLEKYKTVCVELAQVKSALVVSDNRADALFLELQNMKQVQNTAEDELKGDLQELIEGLHKKRKQKLLESEVGCSSDAVALVEAGGGLDMYDDAEI